MGRIKASAFNEASENIALARFTDGIVHSLTFDMNVNAFGARGNLVLDYENFKIDMLKIKSQRVEGHKVFKSFLANTFAIKDSNHEPPLKKATIKFDRKEQKSIFNPWWKALISDLKNQIGIF